MLATENTFKIFELLHWLVFKFCNDLFKMIININLSKLIKFTIIMNILIKD